MRVLFVLKNRLNLYGQTVGLVSSANFVSNAILDNFSWVQESNVISVVDGNSIDRYIHHYKPSVVVIEAIWATPDKIEELSNKYPNITLVVRIHSKIPFLANEGIAIDWIRDYTEIGDNVIVSFNNEETNNEMSEALGRQFLYLPNIYYPKLPKDFTVEKKKHYKKSVDIGCFGAIRPLKNQLLQAVAAITFANRFKKKLRFHINSSRTEQTGENVLKNIRALFKDSEHELIEHEWTTHEEFLKIVAKMDVGLQVSMSESFNIVSADHVYVHTPIVGSLDISWLDINSKCDIYSVDDIVDHIEYSYKNDTSPINQKHLANYNKVALKNWKNFLINWK